jgi:carbonic anhydrase
MRPLTREQQVNLTPFEALELLKEGNQRFIESNRLHHDLVLHVEDTTEAQFPFAALLGCIDSRAPAEHIFDLGIGHLFNVRVAGNIVNEDVLGSLEYACKVAGSKVIVVMGHTGCGAVTSATQDVQMGNVTALLSKIKPAIELYKAQHSGEMDVNEVVRYNVKNSIQRIKNESPILAEMIDNEEIIIVGAIYDVASGEVEFC